MNQPYIYTYPFPLGLPSNSALITVPCAMHCAIPFWHQGPISRGHFFHQPGKGVCFRMIQVHDIYCTFVYLLLYYYISSTWFYIRSSGIRSRMLGTLPYCIFSLVIYFIHSINSGSNPSFPPTNPCLLWCPYVCSLCLCLYFCFANMITCTVFLDSTCMH